MSGSQHRLNFPVCVVQRWRTSPLSETSCLPDLCGIQHRQWMWESGAAPRHAEGGVSPLRSGVYPAKQFGCLLYLHPKLEGFTWIAWDYVESFWGFLRTSVTGLPPRKVFPFTALGENSHSESRSCRDQSVVLNRLVGKGGGKHLDTEYSFTETDLPPQGELWNFKSPIPEFSSDSSKGNLWLKQGTTLLNSLFLPCKMRLLHIDNL